jgi:hypothetical protein
MTSKINIDKLEPHSYSEQLFDQQTPSDRFIEDISERLENPIIIDDQNRIIDGVRRWKAAKELGWDEIEARTQKFDSEEQAELAILRHDDNREANPAQKIQIGYEYKKQIAPLIEKRVEAGKPIEELDLDFDLPAVEIPEDEQITARGLAANRVGWSESKFYQGKRIFETSEGERDVPDEVEEAAGELMDDLAEGEESVNSAFETLGDVEKRQERTDPVGQKYLPTDNFARVEKTFDQVENDLDPTSGWKDCFTTLKKEYNGSWGSPTAGQKHVMAYQLAANGVADPYGRGDDPKPDSDELEKLYWGENGNPEHTLTELSIHFGVREDVIRYWLWQDEIDRKQGDLTDEEEAELN